VGIKVEKGESETFLNVQTWCLWRLFMLTPWKWQPFFYCWVFIKHPHFSFVY